MLVDFYLLAQSPVERALPSICEKVLASGERLLVVADPALLEALDGQLWTYSPESFLPHGRTGLANAEAQPVLLSETAEPANGAANVAIADGRWREEALGFARAFYFFGPDRLDEARASWKSLKDRPGVERRYWKQDGSGRWIQGP